MGQSSCTRRVFNTLITSLCAITSHIALADTFPVTVTDVAGRTITINSQPENIALSTGRLMPLLEIMYQKDAIKHLVVWRDDMRLSAPSMYSNYTKVYPELKNLMKIGKIQTSEFDTERFINMTHKPDLFVVDLANIKIAEEKGLLKKLDKAGIKVLAVDFREHPIKNTLQSVTSLATALGRKEQGQHFADYYQEHIKAITDTIASLPESEKHKKVFIERAAGYNTSCCRTFATGNMGAYIPYLGATNIAEKPLKGAVTGQMSAESIIVDQPDVYIMQSTGWIDKDGNATAGIPLGYGPVHKDGIKKATSELMNRPFIKATKAYQNHDVYSIYMPFYNSPYNLVAIEYFAKWLHPEQFKDLDPEHTFEEMNLRFGHRKVAGIFGQNNTEAMQ